MSNVNDIFNAAPSIEQLGNQVIRDEFNPSAKNSKTGTYTALIRFVTWYKNPQKPIVSKWESYLTDPITKQSRVVDSLKNFNSSCPINDTYWTLQNTKDVQMQTLAKKHINTYNTFASLIQIIQDDVHPENNGKILVWRFKKTIYEKITNEIKPQFGTNPSPFDPINGRYFAVNVSIKNGYNNYDNCQFVNANTSGLYINNGGNFVQIDANTDRQLVYDFLVNNSPDLDAYLPKEWDEKTSTFVTNALENINRIAQGGGISNNIGNVMTPSMPNSNPLASSPIGAMPIPTPTPQTVATPAPMVEFVAPKVETITPNPVTLSAVPNAPTFTSNNNNTSTPNMGGVSGIDLPPVINNTPTPEVTPTPVGLGLGLNDIIGNM